MSSIRKRADMLLVERGLFESRARARAAIEAGHVTANDKPVLKASEGIAADAVLRAEPAHPFVSRGGVKLAGALEQYPFEIEDHVCLDVGASTGGFTEVLLAGGATKVYAVDVGHGQMHPKISRDKRVVQKDGVNARDLSPLHMPEAPQAITADVSFIGLQLALPPALATCASSLASLSTSPLLTCSGSSSQ